MREALKVNSQRAVLIEKKYRPLLEKELSVAIEVEGETVHIEGEAEHVFKAKPVVEAIARGFSAETALKLKNDEYVLHVEDLREYCNTMNCIERLRARVIGRQGSIKTTIERATDSSIAVYGHTVSVIAPFYSIDYAVDVIRRILRGAKHSSVLRYLSELRKKLFYQKLSGEV